MASRRARVKVAPKLTLGRSKPSKPKPVLATESSRNVDANVVDHDKPDDTAASAMATDQEVPVTTVAQDSFKHSAINENDLAESLSATPGIADAIGVSQVTKDIDSTNTVNVTTSATNSTVTNIDCGINKSSMNSDWEDDQFAYNTVDVDAFTVELAELINKATTEVTVKDSNENNTIVNGTFAAHSSPMSPKMRLALPKNKFKPNLFTDRRSRNASGSRMISLAQRTRTVSGSGTDSETECFNGPNSPRSPACQRSVQTAPLTEKMMQRTQPAKVKRAKDVRNEKERSQFMKRKQDHKRRFHRGVPERGHMTMFDLIYYNPENGTRMSIDEEEHEQDQEKVDDPDGEDISPAAVLDAEPDPPPTTSTLSASNDGMPCPQVKVGLNGEIILDDSSLLLETTEAKKAKDFMQNSPIAIVENNRTTSTNYGTWAKKRKHVDWSEKETLRFYKALSIVGSDFSMMESIFKKRTRQELKLKFKKEERLNGKMIDKCLRERGMYTELEGIMQDSEEDSEPEERGRIKVAKKRPRGRYRNKGYYDSSSGGEEADSETSQSPARKRQRDVVRMKRRAEREVLPQSVKTNDPVATTTTPATSVPPTTTTDASSLAAVRFPPGLLAANPGLVGARPGSLVVVASPSKTDPTSQLLHVYMVSNRQKDVGKKSPRATSPRASSPRHILDPAVVRAVNHSRLANRSRAMSECEDSPQSVGRPERPSGPRQRTFSEGSSDLRTELVRQQFLSGTAKSVPGISQTTTEKTTPIKQHSATVNPIENDCSTNFLPIARKSKPT